MTKKIYEEERISNEGSDAFTDFFQRDSPFNHDVGEDYNEFMNNNEVDFMTGKVRRIKNG